MTSRIVSYRVVTTTTVRARCTKRLATHHEMASDHAAEKLAEGRVSRALDASRLPFPHRSLPRLPLLLHLFPSLLFFPSPVDGGDAA